MRSSKLSSARKLVERFGSLQIGDVTTAASHRKRPLAFLLVAEDDHERNLRELRVADSLSEGLVGSVELGPNAALDKLGAQRSRAFAMRLGDRYQPALFGCEPNGQVPARVLEQDSDESLERAEQRSMNHHRLVLDVVATRVAEPEPLGHLEVELDRAELPGAAERVLHMQVDLRPVEGPVALVDDVIESLPLERSGQRRLGAAPIRVVAQPVLRAG